VDLMKLLSKKVDAEDFVILNLGKNILLDGTKTLVMAGPCAAESRDQILESAEFLSKLGVKIFRAGLFKPRTNPYAFQGSGSEGLEWLKEVKEKFGMLIISEVMDLYSFEYVSQVADIIQVGAKEMYNISLLKAVGNSGKPVLIKRHFAATVEELLRMTDYVMLQGNNQIMLCERGIRTFETSTRFTLDLSGAAVIQETSRLPLIIDPSHAIGLSFGVPKLARAAAAFGVDGLIIEVHPNRCEALCDKDQAMSHEEFELLYKELKRIVPQIGRELI
jgi:3-deoxy-7-phosphoheptulonate synthase